MNSRFCPTDTCHREMWHLKEYFIQWLTQIEKEVGSESDGTIVPGCKLISFVCFQIDFVAMVRVEGIQIFMEGLLDFVYGKDAGYFYTFSIQVGTELSVLYWLRQVMYRFDYTKVTSLPKYFWDEGWGLCHIRNSKFLNTIRPAWNQEYMLRIYNYCSCLA